MNISNIGSWFKSLSPEAQKAIIAGGFSAGGSFLENMAAGRRQDQQLQQSGASQVLGSVRPGELPNTYASLAMRGALMGAIQPGTTTGNIGRITPPSEFAPFMGQIGGLDLSGLPAVAQQYLSPDALAADQQRRQELEQQVLRQTLNGQQSAAQGQKKTPWWKKALGIGLGAAGLIAAPFTGGATTALIGAGGALAGSKLMGGSNQDALMAALGGALSAPRGGNRPVQPAFGGTAARIGSAMVNPMTAGTNMVQGRAPINVRFR